MRAAGCILSLALLAGLSGCSWFQSLEIDPTRDWTAQKLYSEARDAMNESNWSLAKDYYTKLEASAIQQLDRFLRAYPNHPNSDYALYLKGLATLNEREGLISSMIRQDISERDAQAARDAFDVFKELVGRYPDSRYAPQATRKMHELVLAQARHQLNTARFYFERKAYIAALNRAKVVLRDFQLTSVSDDAMELMAQCYHELKLFDLEKDMRRVIELNKGLKRADMLR